MLLEILSVNIVHVSFTLCLLVAVETTGSIPFYILKPVLERATPEQLFTLEDNNPYLIEDSDDLWLQHCSRKFRGQKPQEYESWRDMFLVSATWLWLLGADRLLTHTHMFCHPCARSAVAKSKSCASAC